MCKLLLDFPAAAINYVYSSQWSKTLVDAARLTGWVKPGEMWQLNFWIWTFEVEENYLRIQYSMKIWTPLRFFEETIRFDVKTSFASHPLSRLIRWHGKPGDITKEFRETAIQFHGTFHGLKIINWLPSLFDIDILRDSVPDLKI